MTAPADASFGEVRGSQPVAVIHCRCTCELGWCRLCNGLADQLLAEGRREVIVDGPDGVWSHFYEVPA